MKLLSLARHWIGSSLAHQFLLITVISTIFIVGLSAWLVHIYVFNQMMSTINHNLVETVATIEVSVQHSFMVNDTDMLQRVFFDMGVQHQANAVRLLNRDSLILVSSVPDEIGVKLDQNDSACLGCHSLETSQGVMPEVQFLSSEDHRVAIVANKVENQIACQECHPDDGQILGMILVEFPAEQLESWQLPFDSGLIIAAILVSGLIGGGIYLLIFTNIIRPLKTLSQTEMSGVTRLSGDNEVKQVARQMQYLKTELDHRNKALADQHRKIDTIYSLNFNIENPPSLEKFFAQSLGLVQEVTGYDVITMRLFDPKTQLFRVMTQNGMSQDMLKDLRDIPADSGFHAELIRTLKPVVTSDMANDPRMTSTTPIQAGYQSLVCIPLLAQDNLVGSMQIVLKSKHIWEQDELRWLALIGRRVGLLIHQIQLNERLQDMAVLEERSRIAQEIHDGLAQLIGSLRLWSDEALISLEESNPAAAQKTLQKIENVAREAYASLRDEMLGLRDTIFPGKDLLKAISEYLKRFQSQWGIQTQLIFDAQALHGKYWPISPTAEVQLLRIIQEALTNVRRHAQATRITLSLENTDDWLKVKIDDDGIGFDLSHIPENRLGLRIMRERAASVGGTIDISSANGHGTELEINIPLRTAQNIQRGNQ